MPHISSNIPFLALHGSIFSEHFQIAGCSVGIKYFIPRVSDFSSRMIAQGKRKAELTKQLKKTFHCYPNVFQRFLKTYEEINISIMKNTW